MTNEPTTPLSAIAGNDQRMTEITDTAGRVALYFRMLRGNGIPEDRAAEMAAEYNTLLLCRHFNVPSVQVRSFYTGEDD